MQTLKSSGQFNAANTSSIENNTVLMPLSLDEMDAVSGGVPYADGRDYICNVCYYPGQQTIATYAWLLTL